MKFLSLCFAARFAIVGLLVLNPTDAQVKRYANLDDFLLDLKSTAASWIDYVNNMQALLCPNQPVCGADGEIERKDVFGTLPAVLAVGNRTLNVEDIASSVGVCCLPCSCSDSCREDDNCCPTKQMFIDHSK